MSPVILACSILPLLTFLVLFGLEISLPQRQLIHSDTMHNMTRDDWILNLSGFLVQGLVIPLLGYYLSTQLFPLVLPSLKGILPLGFFNAFLLNFIGVDFLYYWQHRLFHEAPFLWKLHATHHHSKVVNVWSTSRNGLLTNFLFVYMLLNPILGYLCDSPEGFFAGAMLTASLDLYRHANIKIDLPFLDKIMMFPQDHHRHHDACISPGNYGANLMIWDRIFKTVSESKASQKNAVKSYTPSLWIQLFCPWKIEA